MNCDSNFDETITSYAPGIILIFSTLKLKTNCLSVSPTTMANSLEVRSPFVDHKLIEYILSTNNAYFDKKSSKKILKNY